MSSSPAKSNAVDHDVRAQQLLAVGLYVCFSPAVSKSGPKHAHRRPGVISPVGWADAVWSACRSMGKRPGVAQPAVQCTHLPTLCSVYTAMGAAHSSLGYEPLRQLPTCTGQPSASLQASSSFCTAAYAPGHAVSIWRTDLFAAKRQRRGEISEACILDC